MSHADTFGLKNDVVDFIVTTAYECDLKRVVLFSSRATGRYTEKSDIDLAILGTNYHTFIEAMEERCPTLLPFDFINLSNEISLDLRTRIKKEGVVLYNLLACLENLYDRELLESF